MATRISSPPPMPSRALTLDQAYERAWRAHRAFLQGFFEGGGEVDDLVREHIENVSKTLTRDLIDSGVGGNLAYQLARPPVGP